MEEVQCIRNSFGKQDLIVMHTHWDGLGLSDERTHDLIIGYDDTI